MKLPRDVPGLPWLLLAFILVSGASGFFLFPSGHHKTGLSLLVLAGFGIAGVLWRIDQRNRRLDSELRERHQALQRERFLVDMLMEQSPDHIYFKDRQRRFIRLNRAVAKVFKLSEPAEAIGKT